MVYKMWRYSLLFLVISCSCISSENEDCTCVPYYLCREDRTINTDGAGIVDNRGIRIGSSSVYSPPPGEVTAEKCRYIENCCSLSKQPPPARVTINTTSGTTETKNCGVRNEDEGVTAPLYNLTSKQSAFGEFPWMVGIISSPKRVYQCGGSLIHPSVVLTAAQCVYPDERYIAIAGDWDATTMQELLERQQRNVSAIKIHEDFKVDSYANDIALLFLETPFSLASHISLVCLPDLNTVHNESRCVVSGWGKETLKGNYSSILKKIELPMVSHDVCEKNLRKTRLGEHYRLDDSFVCAGGEEGKDACKGDGGSPLVCPIPGSEGRYHQVGIVSWGIGCGVKNVPGVYTNVGIFSNWIQQEFRIRNYTF